MEPKRYAMIERAENGWMIRVDSAGIVYIARDAAGVVEIIAQIMRVDAEVKRDAG